MFAGVKMGRRSTEEKKTEVLNLSDWEDSLVETKHSRRAPEVSARSLAQAAPGTAHSTWPVCKWVSGTEEQYV